VRFLSIEPLLGPVRLSKEIRKAADWKLLHWVIVGGESGPKARPMHPEWARTIRDECAAHRVKFFFKQVGSNAWVKDGNAKEFLGVDGRISLVRRRKTDQGLLKGFKKSGGRRLDGRMHEAIPARSMGFANFFADAGNGATLEHRMREMELMLSCRGEDIVEAASRAAQ
jgi:protein gp37